MNHNKRQKQQNTAKNNKTPAPKYQSSLRSEKKIRSYIVEQPCELLHFLFNKLAPKGRNAIKSLLTRNQVFVNQQPITTYNYQLQTGQVVTIDQQRICDYPFTGLHILYEDEDLIIIYKEAGLLSMATAHETQLTAYYQLMTYVRRQHPNNRIFIVHRLDRDTSGIMMFAKKEVTKHTLQQHWNDLIKERTYIALVEGKVQQAEATISSWLKESQTLKMYSCPHPNGGLHAITHYKRLQTNHHFSLLEITLQTGRKNQIRVHMEDIGHPIVGDKKYSSRSRVLARLGLHARSLAFQHPTTGKLLRLDTEIPPSFTKWFQPNKT